MRWKLAWCSPWARASALDHPPRQIDPDHPAVRAHRLGGAKRHQPGAASHVQHPLAGHQHSACQKGLLRRRQRGLPQRLIVGRGQVPAVALHPALQAGLHLSAG
jgi:hypothetical protein